MTNNLTYFQMKKKAQNKGEIYIYGDIVSTKWDDSGVTAIDFKKELDSLGNVNEIDVHINSAGGNVFEGHVIYNMLKTHKAKINVYVDALAASIASVIAMSGDTIFMHKNSFLMIHNSWIITMGNSKELRETADLLDKTDASSNHAYLDKATNISEEELKQLLEAETWLTADEALEKGFIDEILGANQTVASISQENAQRFKTVPDDIKKDIVSKGNVENIEIPLKNISEEEMFQRKTIKSKAKNINLLYK